MHLLFRETTQTNTKMKHFMLLNLSIHNLMACEAIKRFVIQVRFYMNKVLQKLVDLFQTVFITYVSDISFM